MIKAISGRDQRSRLSRWAQLRDTSRRSKRRGSVETPLVIGGLVLVVLAFAGQALLGGVSDLFSGFVGERKTVHFITTSAELRPFVHTVLERGEIESSSNVEVRCHVRGRTSSTGTNILEIIPEGTWVEAGDFLVRLDDSTLQTQLIQNQITCANSQSSTIEAQATLDSARLAQSEYAEGTFKEKLALQLSEVFVAEENMRRAEEYLTYSKRLAERGYIPEAQLEADSFAVEKARNELGVAETKLAVLKTFTKEKMLTSLKAAVETAAARLVSRTKNWELDQMQLSDIEDQIAKCVITAPVAGQVVYANKRSRSSTTALIEEGMPVRERQTIITLPDPGKMRVMTKVHESRVGRVRPGMKADLMLDAMPELNLIGRVTDVSEYPLPAISVYMSHVKEYLVEIEIEQPPRGLRPGMTAEVNILVDQHESALQLPIEAVVERNDVVFCAVPTADGGIETRQIVVGTMNETDIVIESGLAENESVVLNVTDPEVLELMDLPSDENANEKIVAVTP